VRAEANEALDAGKLVQINLDGARLPLPFSALNFLDFTRWRGERQGTPWHEFDANIGGMLRGERTAAGRAPEPPRGPALQGFGKDRADRLGLDRLAALMAVAIVRSRQAACGRPRSAPWPWRAWRRGDPARARRLRPHPHQHGFAAMSGPTNRRFVRTARTLLAFQLVAAAGATGLALWAATKVQALVDQRDQLQARVNQLEARPTRWEVAPVEEVPEAQPAPLVAPAPAGPQPAAAVPPRPVQAPRPDGDRGHHPSRRCSADARRGAAASPGASLAPTNRPTPRRRPSYPPQREPPVTPPRRPPLTYVPPRQPPATTRPSFQQPCGAAPRPTRSKPRRRRPRNRPPAPRRGRRGRGWCSGSSPAGRSTPAIGDGTPAGRQAQEIAGYFSILTTMFLRLIKMIIAPLVLLDDGRRHRPYGRHRRARPGRASSSVGWFICASLVSLTLGLILVTLLKPGVGLGLPLPPANASSGVDRPRSTSRPSSRTSSRVDDRRDGGQRDPADRRLLALPRRRDHRGRRTGRPMVRGDRGAGQGDAPGHRLCDALRPGGGVRRGLGALAEHGPSILGTFGYFMGSFYLGLAHPLGYC
jgi:hypothetical protein